MKTQSWIYIALLLVLYLAGCDVIRSENKEPASEYGEPMLSLILTLDKARYASDETIEADVILKNTGTSDVTVNARMASSRLSAEGEIIFVIRAPSGNAVMTKGEWRNRMIAESDFMVLMPGRGILDSYNLREDYELDEFGTYSVFVIYHNQTDPRKGTAAWKGELESNTVTFKIEP